MTVAIAAMCGWPNDVIILAAADQMITSGDIEFEQPQPKAWWLLEKRAVAIFFGLSEAQTEIARKTETEITAKNITDIGVMAETYAKFVRDYVRLEAEADVLAPLSLTLADLTQRPSRLSQSMLTSLTKQMQTYYRGSGLSDDLGGALIIGTDPSGAHVYKVEDGHARFMDGIGFVAAGGGQWHAESQFMFSRYTRWWPFADALSLVYAAKKRAEVAPGVGEKTDIVIVFTSPPNVMHFQSNSPLILGLEKIYGEHKKKQDEDLIGQHKAVKTFIDELIKPPAAPQASTGPVQAIGELPPAPPVEAGPPDRGTPPTPSSPRRKRRAAQ